MMKIISQPKRVQRLEEFMRFTLTKMEWKAEKLWRKTRKSLMGRFTTKSKKSTSFQMERRKSERQSSKETRWRRKFITWEEERMFQKKLKTSNLEKRWMKHYWKKIDLTLLYFNLLFELNQFSLKWDKKEISIYPLGFTMLMTFNSFDYCRRILI